MMTDSDNLYTKIRKFAGSKKREIKRQLSSDAKEYYRSYVANDRVSPLNEQLIQDVLSYSPKSAFEFGCGVGKNLELLKMKVRDHLGIDISEKAIEIAKRKGLNVICADESRLKTIENYDIVFTCSVLDHIPYIDEIVKDLKSIANIAIVIAETNTLVDRFYYPHDYESLGFVKTDYSYTSTLAKEEAVYHIWHYKKEKSN